MAKKKIFIGSSTEGKELAKKIAQHLAKSERYDPLRWWDQFELGSTTIDVLFDIANSVDGAIFLFREDDKIWYRGKSSGMPRDNVLLEFGIFSSKLGTSQCVILREEETKLPTDITGITCQKIYDDHETVAEETLAHFNRVFGDSVVPRQETIVLVGDPTVIQDQLSDVLPISWVQRALYYGIEGAKGWLDVVKEPSYRAHDLEVQALVQMALEKVEPRTFVSFGPGDAEADKEIASTLKIKEPLLNYIPVDISDGLLQRAIHTLGDQVRVPIGILGDFEDRLNFIQRQLAIYGVRPILFTLLGNTLGNLDKYERKFFNTLHSIMTPSDYLLLDVSLAGPKWAQERDPRAKHSAYKKGYKKFIALGISHRSGDTVGSIVSNFSKRVAFKKGHSQIDNTKSVKVIDVKTGKPVFVYRRYNWDSLRKWVSERGFDIIFEGQIFQNEVLGDGVILAKLKG